MNEGESTIPEKVVKKAARKSPKAPAAPKAPKAAKAAPAVLPAAIPVAKTEAVPAAALTTIVAKVDVGFGNMLFLRGTGPGLSWEKGVEMTNSSADEWTWSTTKASADFVAKVLVNDVVWSNDADATIAAGKKTVIVPSF
jgi:hypothetical protein